QNSGGTSTGGNQGFTTSPCPQAAIGLSTSAMSFTAQQGGTPPLGQNLTVSNIGGASLNWAMWTDAWWITVSSGNGTAPSTVSVTVNPSGLGVGTYQGALTVGSVDGSTPSQTVVVTLTLP